MPDGGSAMEQGHRTSWALQKAQARGEAYPEKGGTAKEGLQQEHRHKKGADKAHWEGQP